MLRWLSRVLCRVFFRNIYISGTPHYGPSAIWAANHTSGIVDPMVLHALAPRPLRPLAKSTLWGVPVLKQILQTVRAIPVFRVQDMRKDVVAEQQATQPNTDVPPPGLTVVRNDPPPGWRKDANSSAFDTVAKALCSGDSILIFPEGFSHDDPTLHALKTGFARMALQAMAQAPHPRFAVTVQPVAIDYYEKDEFRSDLMVHYCEPITITSSEIAVEDIMTGVRASLLEGLACFSSWAEKKNWIFIFETAYQRKPHSAREFRKFFDRYKYYFGKNEVFLARVQSTRRMLRALSLSPSQLLWGQNHFRKRSFFWMMAKWGWFYYVLSVPSKVIMGLVWYAPYRLCGFLADVSTRERDVLATMKIAHGLYLFPLWSLVVSATTAFGVQQVVTVSQPMLLWLAIFLSAPLFSALCFKAIEVTDFFPAFMHLAKLRLLNHRCWIDVMEEWEEIANGVMVHLEEADAQLAQKKEWAYVA